VVLVEEDSPFVIDILNLTTYKIALIDSIQLSDTQKVYTVTIPTNASGQYLFSGVYSVDGQDTVTVHGDATINVCNPTPEVCDNIDNDCDGQIDEGLAQACGTGTCSGNQVCTAGQWSTCDSEGSDCGTCALCDPTGSCSVYDETQDSDCDNGLFCDGQEECALLTLCTNPTDVDCSNFNDQCSQGVCDEGSDSCIADPAPLEGTSCNDDLFCTENDQCSQGSCGGDAVECIVLMGIMQCDFSPDDNLFTFDHAPPVEGVCEESAQSCIYEEYQFSHTCDVDFCGAECDSTNPCPSTSCEDGCVGDDYYEYDPVFNECLGDCSCEQNQCGAPTIFYDDSRCTSSYCINIQETNLLDANMNPVTEVTHPATYNIQVVNYNQCGESIVPMLVVQVFKDNVPVKIGTVKTTIVSQTQSVVSVGFQTEGAGAYEAKVYNWNHWVSHPGWETYSAPGLVEFTVL